MENKGELEKKMLADLPEKRNNVEPSQIV